MRQLTCVTRDPTLPYLCCRCTTRSKDVTLHDHFLNSTGGVTVTTTGLLIGEPHTECEPADDSAGVEICRNLI